MITKQLDFTACEEKARTMSNDELHYAILDCVKTAAAMDSIDRVEGGDRAGYYRDEMSVYEQERTRRSAAFMARVVASKGKLPRTPASKAAEKAAAKKRAEYERARGLR